MQPNDVFKLFVIGIFDLKKFINVGYKLKGSQMSDIKFIRLSIFRYFIFVFRYSIFNFRYFRFNFRYFLFQF